jgi:DNA/RNA-binding domain of Phe-tRNA-synthetase-like protein
MMPSPSWRRWSLRRWHGGDQPDPSGTRAQRAARLALTVGKAWSGTLMIDADRALADAWIDPRVWEPHPDYLVLLITADGLAGRPGDIRGDDVLVEAESAAAIHLGSRAPEDLPEIAVWRAAFATFGVKPRVARSGVEALLRRAASGLPRIEPLTDLYNAVSVTFLVPIGGEDLDGYDGPPRLVVADGTEPFDTQADGQPMVHHADPGEVVWRDDTGVTCRRWNWRQCTRTRLTPATTRALFILDGLGEGAADRVHAAGAALEGYLRAGWPSCHLQRRVIARES